MESTPLSHGEHEEFRETMKAEVARLDAENNRQNHRLDDMEQRVEKYGELCVSVEKLAQSVNNVVKMQAEHNERIGKLENRDGEMWRGVVKYVVTTIIGILAGYVFAQIGIS